MTRIGRPLVLVTISLILGACASRPNYVPVPLVEANENEVRSLLGEGKVLDAFELLDLMTRRGDAPAALRTAVQNSVVEGFSAALEKEEYGEALRYRLYPGFEDVLAGRASLPELQLSLANKLKEEGKGVPAVLTYLSSDARTPENDQAFAELARSIGHWSLADTLVPGSAPQGAEDLSSGETVTVIVNRGMKIEGGVGIPNIVIGSGFFVDFQGYLVTNFHVIESEVDPKYEGFSRISVRLGDERKIPATLVGWDPVMDLALLKTEYEPKGIYSLSSRTDLKPGMRIYAVGSPGGLQNTLTSGIVSSVERRLLQMGKVVQVDVPINAGNSGGPLLSPRGEVLGVVFAGIEQFEGINFAIEADVLNLVLPQLYQGGEVKHSWMGVSLAEEDGKLEISYVVPGTPAYEADLHAGDVLLSVNDVPVSKLDAVHRMLMKIPPGALTKATVSRDGKEFSVAVALDGRPRYPIEYAWKRDRTYDVLAPVFGFRLVEAGKEFLGPIYRIDKLYRNSVAEEAGFSKDDPVTIINWQVDEERRVATVALKVKKRKAGFLESVLQLTASLESTLFI